jgi:hypothetical protein
MSKAASPSSKLTRRAAIAAALAGLAAPASAAPALLAPDPVFAAIAAHKGAYVALDQACGNLSRMERAIPKDRRQEWFDEDRGKGIGLNDDLRWTAALAANRAAFEAEARAAWVLAHARPLSLAGAAALLRYAAEYEDEGSEWPSEPETEDGEEEWMITFHQNLAAALETMG